MRIATWNIGEDESKKDGKLDISSYKCILNVLKQENIDILCMQEAIIKSDYITPIAEYIKQNSDLKYNIQFELSDSHINIGCRMGVVICSKYEIKNPDFFKLDNPNLVYQVNKETTYYSHDKGFIISDIQNFKIISGHCLPFGLFKKDHLDYLEIFEKADKKFCIEFNKNSKFVLCGDFNYEHIEKLFPNTLKHCTDVIDVPTKNNIQSDHILIGNSLTYKSKKVLKDFSDHNICIVNI